MFRQVVSRSIRSNSVISTTSRSFFGGGDKAGSGGMFGQFGNMMESLKKAQEVAKQVEELNRELTATYVTGSDTSGKVKVTFNGVGGPVKVDISEDVADSTVDGIAHATTVAMMDAHRKSQQLMISRMQELYQKAGLPFPAAGGNKLPGF